MKQRRNYTRKFKLKVLRECENGKKTTSILMKHGSPEKFDYEYVRNGTANIFMAVEFKAGKRVTRVTKRRNIVDFAQFVKI